MPLRRMTLWGVIFAAMGVVLLLWLVPADDPHRMAFERTRAAAAATVEQVPAAPAPIKGQPFDDVEPPAGCVRLRVLTTARKPIAGAVAAWMHSGERGRAVGAEDVKHTGVDGCVDIPYQDGFDYIAVSHPGHGVAQVASAVSGQSRDVVLPGGLSYRVTCQTPGGEPVRGVRLLCSGDRIQFDREARTLVDSATWVPGGRGGAAIRAALTDASGTATVGGLEAGTWHAAIQHDSFVAVDKEQDYQVQLHDNWEERITMAALLLAVAQVEDKTGRFVKGVCNFNDQRFSGPQHFQPETGRIRELRQLWSRRFPKGEVFATTQPSLLPDAIIPDTVEMDVVVPGFDAIVAQVPLLAPATWDSPAVIQINADQLRPIPSGQITVQVQLLDGKRAPVESLLLRPHEWTRNIGTQDIAVGETLVVPFGQYSFMVSDSCVVFPETACSSMRVDMSEKTAPVAATIRMLTQVQRVDIDIRLPQDATPLTGELTLRSGKHELRLSARRSNRLLLPVGDWTVEWDLWGLRSGTQNFSCSGTDTSEVAQIVTLLMELK